MLYHRVVAWRDGFQFTGRRFTFIESVQYRLKKALVSFLGVVQIAFAKS